MSLYLFPLYVTFAFLYEVFMTLEAIERNLSEESKKWSESDRTILDKTVLSKIRKDAWFVIKKELLTSTAATAETAAGKCSAFEGHLAAAASVAKLPYWASASWRNNIEMWSWTCDIQSFCLHPSRFSSWGFEFLPTFFCVRIFPSAAFPHWWLTLDN